MEYTDELLTEIQEFAHCYMLKAEIAIITGADIWDINDKEHPAGIAFLKGRLLRKAEFNTAVIKLTGQLSSPAMAIEHKMAESVYLNDMRHG